MVLGWLGKCYIRLSVTLHRGLLFIDRRCRSGPVFLIACGGGGDTNEDLYTLPN